MNRFQSFEARVVELMSKAKAELVQLVACIEHGFEHDDFRPFEDTVPVEPPAVAPAVPVVTEEVVPVAPPVEPVTEPVEQPEAPQA